jgi:hypothetical protein
MSNLYLNLSARSGGSAALSTRPKLAMVLVNPSSERTVFRGDEEMDLMFAIQADRADTK